MATLETRDLHTHFGQVRAVDGVDLDVKNGEFIVLLGASGSGKTTLMRTIAGLEKPTSGDVFIGGRLANRLPPKTRNIAMVFQSYALYPHKTAYRNIAFPLQASHMPADKIRSRVTWAANLLSISHLLDRRPRALSGGERQRVALARALVREPAIFLMDEPLSNLDAKLRHSARRELKRLHRETGVTTIYVTHDQVEAMGLGERVAVMNAGRIEQIGAPLDIYRNPVNTFVAQFMGSPPMNLVLRNGTLIGFHAEDFFPRGRGPNSEDMEQLTFRVVQVEELGSEVLVYGYVAEDEREPPPEVLATLPTALVSGYIAEGAEYPFEVPRPAIRHFDPVTGLRKD
ncbi:ABC transporter ATP-binding protein [Ensifer sp. LCM 4579]|uniref:ABC transporter ATP-binding protein n=1 Tax=Ensifer sp. LCM 4579 TaxID=1848292 RepID=UPI0008DA06CD|nr:ABC transporter ATP-binding protein [Ensifer sp. LCM 4579]OHV85307.1 ABC transporter [Ensifer sp. LCM 4579]